MAPQRVSAHVSAVIDEARAVKTFRFAVDDVQVREHAPGQYLMLTAPVPDGQREFTRRSFTISASPTEPGLLQITVKRNPAGTVSAFLHDRLSEGDRLDLMLPFGQFTLREGEASRLFLIAGGSGITPLRAILRFIVDRKLPVEALLLDLNRREEDIIFYRELKEMPREHPGVRVTFSLTDPPPGWNGFTGRISAELLEAARGDFEPELVFLCGPMPMMETTLELLTARGIDRARIRTEKFK
jgi:ferredoxin-NADP reductase